jgi:hypothetical protein
MKEEVILRILVQQSPKLELRLRRYGEKKLWGPFHNFWKWLGLYLELFFKFQRSECKNLDCGLISQESMDLSTNSLK